MYKPIEEPPNLEEIDKSDYEKLKIAWEKLEKVNEILKPKN